MAIYIEKYIFFKHGFEIRVIERESKKAAGLSLHRSQY